MSLIDDVSVDVKWLPAEAPEWLRKSPYFQTRDLGNQMGQYTINGDGRLILDCGSTIFGGILCQAFGSVPQWQAIEFEREKHGPPHQPAPQAPFR